MREYQVGTCERLGLKIPVPNRPRCAHTATLRQKCGGHRMIAPNLASKLI